MFSKKIIDSGIFLDLPLSTQCLYFHLNMRADDEGVVDNVRQIMRMVGASEDDIRLLIAKSFLLEFEGEIVVIRDWYIHNTLKKDRVEQSIYHDKLATIYSIGENKQYTNHGTILEPKCVHSIDKYSIDIDKDIVAEYNLVEKNNREVQEEQEKREEEREGEREGEQDLQQINSDYQEIYNELEKLILNVPTTWIAAIDLYINKLSNKLIINAIKETVSNGSNNPKYFKSICDRYIINGYKDIADIEKQKKIKKSSRDKPKMTRDEYNNWFIKNILKT